MNKASLTAGVLLASLAIAAHGLVCDESYHFQSAYQRMLSGKTTATLKLDETKNLDKTFAGATILHKDTEYDLFTDFDGAAACNSWLKTTIDMVHRDSTHPTMAKRTETGHYTKLNAGNYPSTDNIPLDYWFGFTKDTVGGSITIYSIIGKAPADQQLHVWYGNATMKKEIIQKGVGTVLRTLTYRFLQLNNHVDSAALQKILLEKWTTEADNDTQRVTINVQLIKIFYDSTASPVSVARAARPAPAAFQASQVGNLVLIQPGEWKPGSSEPLGLYNMMGQKVAVLHPTGYVYQWNGKTSVGADAPTGVYFVQSGARILGKFFYSR